MRDLAPSWRDHDTNGLAWLLQFRSVMRTSAASSLVLLLLAACAPMDEEGLSLEGAEPGKADGKYNAFTLDRERREIAYSFRCDQDVCRLYIDLRFQDAEGLSAITTMGQGTYAIGRLDVTCTDPGGARPPGATRWTLLEVRRGDFGTSGLDARTDWFTITRGTSCAGTVKLDVPGFPSSMNGFPDGLGWLSYDIAALVEAPR
jgi:hypothetical protein